MKSLCKLPADDGRIFLWLRRDKHGTLLEVLQLEREHMHNQVPTKRNPEGAILYTLNGDRIELPARDVVRLE